MRVAFLIRTLETGGAERQLVALAKSLRRRGHDIVVIVFYAVGPWAAELHAEGVKVQLLGKKGFWDIAGAMLRLRTLLGEFRPDVLHGYMLGANVTAALLKPLLGRTRIVFGIRAAYTNIPSRRGLLLRQLEQVLSRAADAVICNSRAAAELCARLGYDARKLVVIPNGIDTGRFCPDAAARQRIRAEWSVADDELLVGVVARIDAMKDHWSFLEAAAQVARTTARVRFVCVGDGEDRALHARLRARAREIGLEALLRWEPARPDPESVYCALDLGVLPSQYNEGFSNAIAEGMSCGLPFVATDVGDAARLIGDADRLVPPRQPAALAQAIVRALRVRQRGSSEQLRKVVEEGYSLEALAARTEQQLFGLLRRA